MTDQFEPNEEDVSIIRSIAESDMDRPVLMLNLNRYFESVSFPGGKLYKSYMGVPSKLLESPGGEKLHESIAIWYPSHKAFLSLRTMLLSEENSKITGMCVKHAVLHRFPENVF
tara:strand:- start:125 stop:466 length:342 start_codon:yes stop_codon:yes gene_type:complete